VLGKLVLDGVDESNGRPGMFLWRVLVMGVLRLNLNWDYDRLQEMVNHTTGPSARCWGTAFGLQSWFIMS